MTFIVQLHCGCLPDEALIDTVLQQLALAKMTPTQLNVELELRSKKLAAAPGPAFVVFLAKQFATGKYRLAPPALRIAEPEPVNIRTTCNYCGADYGEGVCSVDAEGEILGWEAFSQRHNAGDTTTDANGFVDCPVCVTPKVSPA